MTTWVYHGPDGWSGPKEKSAAVLGIPVETLGRTQAGVMLRARKSISGMVIPNGNRERLALYRLKERELVTVWRLGRRGSATSVLVGQLTKRGYEAWLRVKEER